MSERVREIGRDRNDPDATSTPNLRSGLTNGSMNGLYVRSGLQTTPVQHAIQFRGTEDVIHRLLNERADGRRHGQNRSPMRKEVHVWIDAFLANEREPGTEIVISLNTPNDGGGSLLQPRLQINVIGPVIAFKTAKRNNAVTQFTVFAH